MYTAVNLIIINKNKEMFKPKIRNNGTVTFFFRMIM